MADKSKQMHQPIAPQSRIPLVDALRGFCLLGIIIANIPLANETGYLLWNTNSIDGTARSVHHILVSTKFITLFSILFGFGFSIQLKRAAEKNIRFRQYFFLRMLLLLLIGCIHAYVLWFGDIIRYYAICGMLLLLVHQWPTKRIFRLSLGFLILTALVFILNGVLELQRYSYDYSIPEKMFSADDYLLYLLYNFTIDPMINFVQDSPLIFVSCFGKILFGYWLGRTGFFEKRPSASRLNWWIGTGLVAGFAGSTLFWMVSTGKLELDVPLLWLPFFIAGGLFLHSLFYLAAFVRIYEKSWGRNFLNWFTPMGRMALTNYLLQTVFYLLLFYRWTGGPALYGKLSAVETYAIAVLLFLLQAALSNWWMRRHAQGPVEWMWKKSAYRLVRPNAALEKEEKRTIVNENAAGI